MSADTSKKTKGKAGVKSPATKTGMPHAAPSHFSTKPVNHGVKLRQKVM